MTAIDPTFSVYRAPGVYVAESPTPLASILGLGATVIALVGPSVGHRTYTEAVTLNALTDARLTQLGIDTGSIEIFANDGSPYSGSDWVATEGGGEDGDTETTSDNTMDIKRSGTSTITDGETVVVAYEYTDASYFDPIIVTDYDTVKQFFGEPFDNTGAVISPMSLAAKLAFDNGAATLVLVATVSPTSRSALSDAYVKLSAIPEVNVIVPLPIAITGDDNSVDDVDNIAADLKTHCDLMATDKMYRVGILSYDTGVERSANLTAVATGSRRVILSWPFRMSYFNGLVNQTIEIGGCYGAAGYAGRLASLAFQEPLTRKQLLGFSGIPSSVLAVSTASFKNTLGAAGVAVTERTRDGRLVCRHGVTTDITNVHTKEINLVRSRDALLDQLQRTFDQQGIIGSPITAETPARLRAMAEGVLEGALTSGVIADYKDVTVRQRTEEPTVMEIKFSYIPSYPLNYVVLLFSVNTESGSTTFSTP